jgi:Family of unknown function (DUF6088)
MNRKVFVENNSMFFQHIMTLTVTQVSSKKLLARINGNGRGWVFTPKAFADLGDPRVVGVVLGRLVTQGKIRKLARGLYDYPKSHPRIGLLSPDPAAIAQALVGSDRIRLLPSGAYAANLLRLSEQVPAKIVFLTDGPTRLVKIGRQEIRFRRTTPRNLETVIQALRHVGKDHITPERITTLRTVLTEADRKTLLKDSQFAPAWMRPQLRSIAEDSAHA